MRELTERQRAFCEAYMDCLVGSHAAVRAGYSETGAKVRAFELLRNPRILAYLAELKEKRIEAFGLSSVKVLNELAYAAFADIGDVIEWGMENMLDDEGDQRYLPNGEPWTVPYVRVKGGTSADLAPEVRRMVSEVSMSKEGVFKVKMVDKMKALDMLMKHLGLFARAAGAAGGNGADEAMAALGTIKKLIEDSQGAPMRPGLRPTFTLIEGGQSDGAAAAAATTG